MLRVPCPTLNPLGSLHQGWHNLGESLWCPPCVVCIGGIFRKEVLYGCFLVVGKGGREGAVSSS
jgi:hypothetical protein